MLGKHDELRERVEMRKRALLAKCQQLKEDTREEAAEARSRLNAYFEELEHHVKSRWSKVNGDVRTKLSTWLERRD
jgi:hypothetical protein